jgi:hypothetical protein
MPADIKELTKRTHFGITSLLIAILSAIFLAAYFGISQLDISPGTFFLWNNIIALAYCLMTPSAGIFAVLAWRRKKDSKSLAAIALAIISIPFVFLFVQFVLALIP